MIAVQQGFSARDAASSTEQKGSAMKFGEILFEVKEACEGGYNARARGYSIFTQGESWDDLKAMVRDAVLCHFDQGEAPGTIRLRLVGGEDSVTDPIYLIIKTNG